MIRFFKRPGRWAAIFSLLLVAAIALVLLDAFVFPRVYAVAAEGSIPAPSPAVTTPQTTLHPNGQTNLTAGKEAGQDGSIPATGQTPEITATSYTDENISITVETVVEYDTTYYVADIQLSNASLLQTALAGGVYGRNIKQTTSAMAMENGALLAVNGDYYGFRDDGFVVRNGVLYRDVSAANDALVIDSAGDFSVVSEGETTAEALLQAGAWQVLSFGPALVQDGAIAVAENQEVTGKSSNSNPRTAIGQIGKLHYLVVVSDGRTDESAGLSLYQLAQVFKNRGAIVAYNLDGGGSSSMVFNGQVVNTTTSGRSNNEREVSDIVFFGY